MKEDLTNQSSSGDSKGRVIQMIPNHTVHPQHPHPHPDKSLYELNRNLESLIERMESTRNTPKFLSIPSKKGTEFLREDEIVSCQAKGSYTEIRMDSGSILTDSKGLRHYNRILNPAHFLRTNRAWIVNLHKVIRFFSNTNELETRNGNIIPVSRDLVTELKQRMTKTIIH